MDWTVTLGITNDYEHFSMKKISLLQGFPMNSITKLRYFSNVTQTLKMEEISPNLFNEDSITIKQKHNTEM